MDRLEKALGFVLAVLGAGVVAGCASGGFGERPGVESFAHEAGDSDVVTLSFVIKDADLTESHVVVEYQVHSMTGSSHMDPSDTPQAATMISAPIIKSQRMKMRSLRSAPTRTA